MIYLTQNIKYLRSVKRLTQQQLANELEVKRALIGAYEEGRATPKLGVLQQMASLFGYSVDDLIGADLSVGRPKNAPVKNDLQVLPIIVNSENEELIPIVPVKASAGYLNGYTDPEFIEELPRFSLPVPELSKERTYRVFQISGDSMLPVPSGSYVFCEFVQNVGDLVEDETYVFVTRDEGLVYKRVQMKGSVLLLNSDNPAYSPYEVEFSSLLEVWKARGVLSFELPRPKSDVQKITNLLLEVKDEIRRLKN